MSVDRARALTGSVHPLPPRSGTPNPRSNQAESYKYISMVHNFVLNKLTNVYLVVKRVLLRIMDEARRQKNREADLSTLFKTTLCLAKS